MRYAVEARGMRTMKSLATVAMVVMAALAIAAFFGFRYAGISVFVGTAAFFYL